MARTTKSLTDKQISNAKPQDKEYTLFDGNGLRLRVKPNGTKTWLFNYTRPHNGKRANMTFGSYPSLSLTNARKKALGAIETLQAGIDPQVKLKNQQTIEQQRLLSTLAEVTNSWLTVAEQKKRDSEAVSAGIRQGLANFDTSVKTLPTYSQSNTNNYVPRPNLSKQYTQIQPTYMDRMEKREQALATMKNATQAGNKTTTAPSVASAASSQPSTNGTTVQANPTQQTGGNAKPISTARTKDFKEAIAYCWTLKEPKSGQKDIWFCHGPIQKTLVATTLPKAMELVGCDYPNALRKWDFKDGVVHACDLGLENYDEDVANLYQVPSVITKNLHQYRCNLPYQGRCRTTR